MFLDFRMNLIFLNLVTAIYYNIIRGVFLVRNRCDLF